MQATLLRCTIPALAAILCGCDFEDLPGGVREREEVRKEMAMKSGSHFELESFNGSVEIRGWDQDRIEIAATKTASSRDLLDEIKIDISQSADGVRIRSVRPEGRHSNMGVSYVISLPRKTTMDRVASSNGSIRIESVEGAAKLRSSNGSVRLSQVKGDLDASTSNGSIELTSFTGGAVLRTSNGAIRASGVRGYFDAQTSNGSIDASIDEAAGRTVRASTSNGKIELAIAKLKDSDVVASSSNSSVVLRLPEDIGARLKAATSNGSINTAFEIRAQGELSKKRIEGTIGGGGPLIDVHTSNASIRIEKM